jgi:hypothetical protein
MYINKPKVTAFGTKISISNAPEQRQGEPGGRFLWSLSYFFLLFSRRIWNSSFDALLPTLN